MAPENEERRDRRTDSQPQPIHIIKLLDQRGGNVELITKTHVRHILLKPNELLTNDDARKKLESIKARIEAGDDFGDLARGDSDDRGIGRERRRPRLRDTGRPGAGVQEGKP